MNVTAGLKPLGWFTKEQIYSISNGIYGAVYAFAFLEKMPEKYQQPNEIEDTIYIGVSGGRSETNVLFFDRKDKNSGRGEYKTVFKDRMKTHFRHLEQQLEKPKERKYDLFHEKYIPSMDKSRQLFVYLTVPGSDIPTYLTRSLLSLAESEYIYAYGQRFQKLPLMNLDEQDYVTRIENSVSATKLKDFKVNSLDTFLV